MNRNQLRGSVTRILRNASRPMKAKDIRYAHCRQTGNWKITTRDINSILYSELGMMVQ